MKILRYALIIGVAAATCLVFPGTAQAATPTFANCTALNKVYPHGVAKPGARDKVTGKTKPVTTFKVNLAVYSANTKRDGDRDGVACEKR